MSADPFSPQDLTYRSEVGAELRNNEVHKSLSDSEALRQQAKEREIAQTTRRMKP